MLCHVSSIDTCFLLYHVSILHCYILSKIFLRDFEIFVNKKDIASFHLFYAAAASRGVLFSAPRRNPFAAHWSYGTSEGRATQ